MLARREHACEELKRKLRARGFEAEEVDACVADLAARELVSDDRFAESFSRARAEAGCGPVRIAQELRQRGVAADVVERALGDHAGTWEQRIEEVRAKRFGGLPPRAAAEQMRQARFLQYKGYSTDQIRRLFSGRD